VDLFNTNPLTELQLYDADSSTDNNSPLSYIEWKRKNGFVSENTSENEYNLYLLSWFNTNKKKTISQQFILRQKYLYLLDQLQLFFSDKERTALYNQINLADDKEILLAIPYFAKRLKDISLYYLNLRTKLKNTKTKYNLVGSTQGLQQEVYSYILETFALSGKNSEHSTLDYQTLPNFSYLQNSLNVEIEELYDDKQYFDISSTQPLSSYFNFSHESTSQYLATKGIVLSSAESLFNLFEGSVTDQDFYTKFSNVTSVMFETTDSDTYSQFIQKYLSENKYITSYVPRLTTTSTIDVTLASGNNYFFYPYGTTSSTFSVNQILTPVPLSSIQITGATAGEDPSSSDTIIVKYGNTTKSAWLKKQDYVDVQQPMAATLNRNGSTFFIFPFPGYGLSGQDLPWTGRSHTTNPEYNFLTREQKAAVNEAYWSQQLPQDTCVPLLLSDAGLISAGATASRDPRFADHIYIRNEINTDTTIPLGEISGAWLYRVDETNLAISTTETNVCLWPYTLLDAEEGFPSYLRDFDFTDACNSVSIQDIPTSYFVAASSIDYADKIYKVSNHADFTTNALACAWLSSASITIADYELDYRDGLSNFIENAVNGFRYDEQDGFASLFPAGEATRFIWSGPVNYDKFGNTIGTSLESVFRTVSHKGDCPFVTNVPATHDQQWENCSCKQVYRTPYGHSRNTFAEGNYSADCIFEVADQELAPVDFGSWRDKYGRALNEAGDDIKFAWYKTSSNSWGGGSWVTDGGTVPFSLMPGKCYIYWRAKSKMSTSTFPPYAATYAFDIERTVWVEAKKSTLDGTWVSTNAISNMEIYAGDILNFERQTAVVSNVLSATYVEVVPVNKNTIWSTYDTIPINCKSFTAINISWPKEAKPFDTTSSQYPPFTFLELERVDAWSIQRLEDGVIEYYINSSTTDNSTVNSSMFVNVPALTSSMEVYGTTTSVAYATGFNPIVYSDTFDTVSFVTPSVLGTYVIRLTATNKSGTRIFLDSSTIPPISCVPLSELTYVSIPFKTPTCGFNLQKNLYGWNYNKQKQDVLAAGAKPYWAVLDTNKNPTTGYKSVYSWGYPNEYIEEYIPNNCPRISPLEMQYGNGIEYKRNGPALVWNLPIDYKQYSGTTQWCPLLVDVNSQDNNTGETFSDGGSNGNGNTSTGANGPISVTSIAKPTPSDIMLSNFIDGDPLEVFYYATEPVTWTATYQTEQYQEPSPLSSFYIAQTPWFNLKNRFNPTIATVPVLEEIYSLADVGGYFLPQHLGASQYINRNYTILLDTDKLTATSITESPNIHVGGRGLSKQDQNTIFDWTEDNQWLKESTTTGGLAGTIKKSLTKILQTFVPYQSNIDETTLGLFTSRTKFSPWGGANDSEWVDPDFDPVSLTGIRSVSAWAAAQITKQNKKDIENWCSDIYGNQYGLFKELTGYPFYLHSTVGGELWVKLNNQIAMPAATALTNTLKTFVGDLNLVSQDVYNNNVQIAECYFDTLFLKTPNGVVFLDLLFDYANQTIETIFDDIRWMLLDNTVRFEKNWFFPSEKRVVMLVTKFQKESFNTIFYPCLYEMDLVTKNLKLIFNGNPNQIEKIYFKGNLDCSFSYDGGHHKFLITYSGIDVLTDKMFFVDYYITNQAICKLYKYVIYKDAVNLNETTIPPFVTHSYFSTYEVLSGTQFTINIPVSNSVDTAVILNNYNVTASISANSIASFTGILSADLYQINYTLRNKAGESSYSLMVNCS